MKKIFRIADRIKAKLGVQHTTFFGESEEGEPEAWTPGTGERQSAEEWWKGIGGPMEPEEEFETEPAPAPEEARETTIPGPPTIPAPPSEPTFPIELTPHEIELLSIGLMAYLSDIQQFGKDDLSYKGTVEQVNKIREKLFEKSPRPGTEAWEEYIESMGWG